MTTALSKSDNVQPLATMQPQSLFAEAWERLSRIDVGDYIETKGDKVKLSYLSWPFAWAELMRLYPESEFELPPAETYTDGTVNVWVKVTIRDGERSCQRAMWLTVMDHMNHAIVNPNARDINDSRMRCLVKCLALFGLGLDIYAKSDMPIGSLEDPITPEQATLINSLIGQAHADQAKFLEWIGADSVEDTPAKKYKQAVQFLERKVKAK